MRPKKVLSRFIFLILFDKWFLKTLKFTNDQETATQIEVLRMKPEMHGNIQMAKRQCSSFQTL